MIKTAKEARIVDIQFNVHKFSNREKPKDIKKILIISCFSEFGCEVIGSMYCIPRLKLENPDCYLIVMGWYGRAYLYKHLVDEFWESKEEFQWLRDFSLAFHHSSKNLSKLEKTVTKFGRVIASDALGKIAVGNKCNKCDHFWGQVEYVTDCPSCKLSDITKALFADVFYWKKHSTPIPIPSETKLKQANKYIGINPVGVIARNRSTYGRNLETDFYVGLLDLLKSKNYTPIWLGEKQSTWPCPVDDIVDFSRLPESGDLELTLAIVSKLLFTIQFWTASTRLSSITGTPFLVFESPDQLFGGGQEAYRLALCTNGKAKIVLSHFLNVANDHASALELVKASIEEMCRNNWQIKIGMVDSPWVVEQMKSRNLARLGGIAK